MARMLILGGGCRGRALAADVLADGHALRITTRSESSRAAIEALGAECWVGTPDRLASLRGALENVTIVCWLLATASGPEPELAALHGPRLESFLHQAIDSTVRGFLYEAPIAESRDGGAGAEASSGPVVSSEMLTEGERLVHAASEANVIPVAFVRVTPYRREAWLGACREALGSLLGGR